MRGGRPTARPRRRGRAASRWATTTSARARLAARPRATTSIEVALAVDRLALEVACYLQVPARSGATAPRSRAASARVGRCRPARRAGKRPAEVVERLAGARDLRRRRRALASSRSAGVGPEGERRHEQREEHGHERSAVEARFEHPTYSVAGRTLSRVHMLERAPRILLADDEQSIQTLLALPAAQGRLRGACRPPTAARRWRASTRRPFDLVVLDVMMPRMDGLEVCRRMRARHSVPIIMLTAKAEEIDKVLGLELGADDYITKPFSLREFRSRVKAALRRAGMRPARARAPTSSRSTSTSCASTPPSAPSTCAARRCRLTYVEFEILVALATQPRAACSRATCCSRASGATAPTATRARSTCTSGTCARSSRATPRTPSTCSPCAAWATASATRSAIDRSCDRSPTASALLLFAHRSLRARSRCRCT